MTTPVSFPIAKLLKEKRFDEYCNQHYSQALFEGTDSDWEGVFPKYSVFLHSSAHFNSKENTNELWFECSAPTIAEVVMWLYEEHGIWIITPFSCNDTKVFCWVITNSEDDCWFSGIDDNNVDGFNSPTEAYSAAIEYCLTKLI